MPSVPILCPKRSSEITVCDLSNPPVGVNTQNAESAVPTRVNTVLGYGYFFLEKMTTPGGVEVTPLAKLQEKAPHGHQHTSTAA